jgi:hypothetical protein
MKRALLLLMLTAATPTAAGEPLTMRLTPAASFEPAILTVRALVEADGDNRGLEIVAESGHFYRSSYIPLEGARAQRINVIQFKNLPSGTYQVTTTLLGSTGARAAASRVFRVVSSRGAPD